MTSEDSIETRLARVERLLEALVKHTGLDLNDGALDNGPSPQVLKFVRDGLLIQAIAAYRTETGVGLREAKDAIDEIKRQMQSR